jgi:uncharacterized protein
MSKPTLENAADAVVVDGLAEMVGQADYPCLGARSVFNRDRASVRVFAELAGEGVAEELLAALRDFARTTDVEDGFASFIAAFRGPRIRDETHFEELLWQQLQQLHDADGQPWNEKVSADPSDEHFAFSAGGTAWFIVGLHPRASRDARRTPLPTLVFNLHEQFERLRETDQFPRMRDTIRRRDEQLQGSINPMVADHGEDSEARQYSGREVASDWEAPFEPHEIDEAPDSRRAG